MASRSKTRSLRRKPPWRSPPAARARRCRARTTRTITLSRDWTRGLNASLIGAQSQVDNAYDAYVKASNAYERYKENVNLGENTQVLSAEASRDNAATALDNAETALDSANSAYKSAAEAKDTLPELNSQIEQDKQRKQGTRGRRRAAVGRVYHTCCGTGNASKAGADD